MRIRDSGWQKLGSGMKKKFNVRDKHPGSATLQFSAIVSCAGRGGPGSAGGGRAAEGAGAGARQQGAQGGRLPGAAQRARLAQG